jgi:lipoprotein-anchoring transpeptidase ErfK/SrfK
MLSGTLLLVIKSFGNKFKKRRLTVFQPNPTGFSFKEGKTLSQGCVSLKPENVFIYI